MSRCIVLLSVLLAVASMAVAQDNTFYRKYNLSGMQGGLQLEATQDGGFVATGQHEGNGSAGSCDVYVYRVDACGNNLWFKLIGNGDAEGGKSIKQTSDGGYIVACIYGNHGALVRMNDAGDVLWSKGYSGTTWLLYADETANGDFICMGQVSGTLYAFRTNSTGDVLWSKNISGMGSMSFYISELPNGDFIFTSTFGIPGKDMAVGRLSANGDLIYGKSYGGTGWNEGDHTSWSCKGLLVDNGEALVVTSPTWMGSGDEDVLLMKVSTADGSVIWSNTLGGAGSDQSRDIALHPHGYAVVGNTNSFPVSVSSNPDTLSQDMGERDVLLLNVDFDGDLIWARTYGGNGRDRGIGVSYNIDNGFTMSAFTNSSFFGSGGDSMDPVFIKTDSLGLLTCQVNTPPIVSNAVNVSVNDLGQTSVAGLSAFPLNPTISNYTPNDVYICQSCYTEPLYEPSDTIICVNEEVDFINTTSVGLTCFQNWVIEGQSFSGELDTLTYAFDEPGLYQVELYSTCGNQDNTYITNIYVYETVAAVTNVSNYNGYEVSCFGENDGAISVTASGGYLPAGTAYDWYWNAPVPSAPSINNLTAGEYIAIATDTQGCADTLVIELNEPELLTAAATVTSDYNGFNVSCFDYNDGTATISASGGVQPYAYNWNSGSNTQSAASLSASNYSCTVTDANGCTTSDGVSLNQPTILQGQITLVSDYNGYEISCFNADDGQAVFNASGGIMPYAITWNGQPYTVGAVMSGLSEQLLNVSLTDLNGCTGQFTATIEQPPLLTLSTAVVSDYNGSDISCPNAANGQCIALPEGGVPPYIFMWEDGSNQDVSTPTLTEGTYSVTVMDANGCTIQGEATLEDPLPIALTAQVTTNYNGYHISCYGYSDGLANAVASGAVPPYTYWWSNGAASNNSGFISAGIHTVYVTDSQQCDTISVQVEAIQPESIVLTQQAISDYNGFGVSCPDAADGWINAEADGGVAPYQYAWSNNNASANNMNISAGVHQLEVTDLNNCDVEFDFVITEPAPLSLEPLIISDTCYKEVGSIQLNAVGGAGNTVAELNGEQVGNEVCCLLSSTYSIELTDANGCTMQQLIEVPNVPGPVADYFLSDAPYCSGQTVIDFHDDSEGQIAQWIWTFGDGERQFDKDVAHLYNEPGIYNVRLRVIDVNGCVDEKTSVVTVSPDLRVFIPNAFTPNQDGDNEAFFPDGSSIVSYDMVIFNRWGDVVFRSTPELPKWNGSVSNANLSSENGVYTYRITIYGVCETKEITGHLLMLR
jgi:gliding motility-associated-like protein